MNFTVFFTNKCNMNCLYCYENNKQQKSIDYNILDSTIDFIIHQYNENKSNDLSVVTHGGEPLIEYDKIRYFIENLDNKINNIKYIITTNATLLTDDIADFLVKHYFEISVSIDGIKIAHDANRVLNNGKGTYETVIKNSDKLIKHGFDVKARMTVNPKNVLYLFDSVKHLIEMKFSTIVPVPDSFCKDWTEDSLNILYEQGIKIINYLKNYPDPINIGLINDSLSRMANSPCNGGHTTFSINTDGLIYPCIISVGNPEFLIGNVISGIDPAKIQEILKWDTIPIKQCAGCSRYNYCNTTRCRIINKTLSNDLHIPSPVVCNIENVKTKLSEYYMKVFPKII